MSTNSTIIEISPVLRSHLKSKGYDCGIGISRKRTMYGEPWQESFETTATIEEVVDSFTNDNLQLEYIGVIFRDKHAFKNCDPRLLIYVSKTKKTDKTVVYIQYTPTSNSLHRP